VSTSICSNFDATTIAVGSYIWFTSVLTIQNVGASPVPVIFNNQTITFTVGGTPYTLSVPDAQVTISPSALCATTDFSGGNWVTTNKKSASGTTFFSGLVYQVPVAGLGGVNPICWSGHMHIPTAGNFKVQWQWAAAVYPSSHFSTDYTTLGVKPTDDTSASCNASYHNSDHAGTPETFKSFVIAGARGGGGSNYTGSYSGTGSAKCP